MIDIFSSKPKFSRFVAIKNLIIYEIKKSIHKKLVIALLILCLVTVFGAVILINYILSEPVVPEFVKESYMKHKWLIIFSMPGFFLALIAISIGGGLFSSEYEDRSSHVLYTKPFSRLDIFIGKFFGGYIVISSLTLFFGVLSILLSYTFFRDIEDIWAAPIIILAAIYAQLIYYSLTYMFSQLTKKTVVSIIIGIAIIIIIPIIQSMLLMLSKIHQLEYIKYIIYILPTWSANLPNYVINKLIKGFTTNGELGDPILASIIIFIYFIITSSITVYNLLRSDLVID